VFAISPAFPVANYVPLSAPAAPARVFEKGSVSDDDLMSGIRWTTLVQTFECGLGDGERHRMMKMEVPLLTHGWIQIQTGRRR
jgi:hypothetical protein